MKQLNSTCRCFEGHRYITLRGLQKKTSWKNTQKELIGIQKRIGMSTKKLEEYKKDFEGIHKKVKKKP